MRIGGRTTNSTQFFAKHLSPYFARTFQVARFQAGQNNSAVWSTHKDAELLRPRFQRLTPSFLRQCTTAISSEVNDSVVNQLLAKIDSVEQLNIIFVIGTTSRRDMRDEALLEEQVDISFQGEMLECRESKIVKGQEILSPWSGESEENVRKTFAEAVEEQKRVGSKSWLLLISFNEIDVICKQRCMSSNRAGNNDTVVN